jgi:hypothetical protein
MNRPAVRTLSAFALLALLAACKPAATPEPAAVASAPSPAATPAPAPVVADPHGEVVAAMRKFWDLHSYHAAMHIEGGPRGAIDSGVDFVAPDRYRMEAPGRGSQVIIGDTMYMDMGGRVTRVPLPAGTLTQWRDPARLADAETEMTVEAQGSDAVDGQPAKKYLVRVSKPKPTEMSVWIGDAGFPLQIATHNPLGDATIKYSRFDDPTLLIEAPK